MPEVPEQEARAPALDLRCLDQEFKLEYVLAPRWTMRLLWRPTRPRRVLLRQQLALPSSAKPAIMFHVEHYETVFFKL
jgi:hypothetical protein